MSGFKLEAFLNPNLALGSSSVTVTMTVSGSIDETFRPRRILGKIIDVSGSMDDPIDPVRDTRLKIDQAKHAARVWVDMLPEDVEFFVIVFASRSSVLVPRTMATKDAKRAAHAAIQGIKASGGTYLSYAFVDARKQFAGNEHGICVLDILTDGEISDPDMSALNAQVKASKGLFQAHCRGFGTEWNRAALQKLQPVADALMGTIGMITDGNTLETDFNAQLKSAMRKNLSDLRLRLWTPKVVEPGKVIQMFPTKIEITDRLPVDQRTIDIPLGAWGQDSQDYMVTFNITPRDPDGTTIAVCRPSLVYTDPLSGTETIIAGEVNYDPSPGWGDGRQGVIEVAYTEDASLTMRVNRMVGHYTDEAEKSKAKAEFAEAWERNDQATATVRLQRVMQLANESGDTETQRMVRQLADVDDSTGTISLRRRDSVRSNEIVEMEVGATQTVRARRG